MFPFDLLSAFSKKPSWAPQISYGEKPFSTWGADGSWGGLTDHGKESVGGAFEALGKAAPERREKREGAFGGAAPAAQPVEDPTQALAMQMLTANRARAPAAPQRPTSVGRAWWMPS